MKTKPTIHQQFFKCKKEILLIVMFISVTCITTSCQTTGSKPGISATEIAFVYGKVKSLPPDPYYTPNPYHWTNYSVVIVRHKYPCSDSTGWSDAIHANYSIGHIKKSGTYHVAVIEPALMVGSKVDHPTCFTAFVALYDSSSSSHVKDYVRLLAGPKKIPNLSSHFVSNNSKSKPDAERLRINFVVHDSSKK